MYVEHDHFPSLFLQHMHTAVELKQQLQIEHERALVALHTKQKEDNQLQKVKKKSTQFFIKSASSFHAFGHYAPL